MGKKEKALALRIFVGEKDHYEGKPLYEAIVLKAREVHLAGATVLRGPMGFGHSSLLHNAGILDLSADLPMVVEITDTKEKIEGFLPFLDKMIQGGMITIHEVSVIHYGPHKGGK